MHPPSLRRGRPTQTNASRLGRKAGGVGQKRPWAFAYNRPNETACEHWLGVTAWTRASR
jgi:hypothetical protein